MIGAKPPHIFIIFASGSEFKGSHPGGLPGWMRLKAMPCFSAHSISPPLTYSGLLPLLTESLEQEKAKGKTGQIAEALVRLDLLILDELGCLPFNASGGALLFHLLSKLYERTGVVTRPISASANGPRSQTIV